MFCVVYVWKRTYQSRRRRGRTSARARRRGRRIWAPTLCRRGSWWCMRPAPPAARRTLGATSTTNTTTHIIVCYLTQRQERVSSARAPRPNRQHVCNVPVSSCRDQKWSRCLTSSTAPCWTRKLAGRCRTWGLSSTRRRCRSRRRPLPCTRLRAARKPIPTTRRGLPKIIKLCLQTPLITC